MALELGESALRHAAWTADHDIGALPTAAATAAAYLGPAAFAAAQSMIQYHGGIGYTWEHDAHFFFKRAKRIEYQYGDAGTHRERIARLVVDGG